MITFKDHLLFLEWNGNETDAPEGWVRWNAKKKAREEHMRRQFVRKHHKEVEAVEKEKE